jgi:hypothetical protein
MLNVFIKHSLLAALFISIAILSLSLSLNTKISVFLFRYPENRNPSLGYQNPETER